MKWYKHDTDAKEDVKIKLLEKEHGLIGYAVYFKTLEIIGKSIDVNNIDDWGFVEPAHTMETLAESVGIELPEYRKIIETCDRLGLFAQIKGRLYCEKILFRLDEYATKILAKPKLQKLINQRKKLSGQTPDKLPTMSGQCRARLDKIRIDKNREDEPKTKPETSLAFLKELPDDVVAEFVAQYACQPSDIKRKAMSLANYCEGHGKTYKNYKAMLRNACLKDFTLRKVQPKSEPLPEISEAEKQAAQSKLDLIRQNLTAKLLA